MPFPPGMRAEAKQRGDKYYFTGVPCSRGHIANRSTNSGRCVECNRILIAEWREKNPDGDRAISRRHYAKTAEEQCRKSREWRAQNRERAKEAVKRWLAANPEKSREINRRKRLKNPEYYREAVRRYRERHSEKVAERAARYRAENADRIRAAERERSKSPEALLKSRAKNAKRAARKRNAEGAYTAADVHALLKAQKGRCAYCRGKLAAAYHVDHIIPLSRGGPNTRANIQICCVSCNCRKGTKDPVEFAQQVGLLL